MDSMETRHEKLSLERYGIEARWFDCKAQFAKFLALQFEQQDAIVQRVEDIDRERGEAAHSIGIICSGADLRSFLAGWHCRESWMR
jgi:hypothetical protein